MKIRIATRVSPLALLQTHQVIDLIQALGSDYKCEVVPIQSEGDLNESPLHLIGGKGLFVSKLEAALVNQEADIAVHSLKDVPALLAPEFSIAATLRREDCWDTILLREGLAYKDLQDGHRIATSGPRRKSQLLAIYPGLNIVPIRGNIHTRINKIVDENLDGLVVAKAALNRLKIKHKNMHVFLESEMLPAASQGAIGIETCNATVPSGLSEVLTKINCQDTFRATRVERDIVAALEGSCLSPISVLGKIIDQTLHLQVRVSNQDGSHVLERDAIFSITEEVSALTQFKEELIQSGAKELIQT
ncbi:hydroxymethylbilane synthase [Gammaproteobacteria bacterium]|nr:hydroxymethylbilane synthase [Gammaproteobacteria bacterium]